MKGSVEGRRMEMYLWCDVSSCSQSTEISHADSLCVKECLSVFFFQGGRQIWTKLCGNPTPLPSLPRAILVVATPVLLQGDEEETAARRLPPPPPLSLHLQTKKCRISITFMNVFEALFPRLWKQNTGSFLTQKESVRLISVDSKQLEKLQQNTCRYHTPPFHGALQIYQL